MLLTRLGGAPRIALSAVTDYHRNDTQIIRDCLPLQGRSRPEGLRHFGAFWFVPGAP